MSKYKEDEEFEKYIRLMKAEKPNDILRRIIIKKMEIIIGMVNQVTMLLSKLEQ